MQPTRRTILLGVTTGAVALWSAALRGARAAPPDQSSAATSPDVPPRRVPTIRMPAGGTAATLYEENPDVPAGKRFRGETRWSVDTKPKGAAAETVVQARVEVPDRGMALTAMFARNRDKSLPASHTIELMFTLEKGFAHGEIDNVPGILMKEAETARGVPLAGLSVKVTTSYFLVGLSQVKSERARNIHMLRDRDWFDLPIAYSDKRRAILAFAKGLEGEQAFRRALAVWADEEPGARSGPSTWPPPKLQLPPEIIKK